MRTSMPWMYSNRFGPKIVVDTTAIRNDGRESLNLLDFTAKLCFCTYPLEPMRHVHEGASPWQMALVLDRFWDFYSPQRIVIWD